MIFSPALALLAACILARAAPNTERESTGSVNGTSAATSIADSTRTTSAAESTSTSGTGNTTTTTGAAARNGTSKRGMAYPGSSNNPEDVRNFNQSDSLITWVYDWALEPQHLADVGDDIEYIPMQWGPGNAENFADAVRALGSKTILGFNEPDFSEQSNMNPSDAARIWKEYIEPLKNDGVRLGGPSVTNSGSGQPWLQRFMSACSDCTIDFIPLHWYGIGVTGFYDYLWQVHGRYPNHTIWITEYADTSIDQSDVFSFMNETAIYMDELDWVERYAWFGYLRPDEEHAYNLLESDGGLNSLGEFYVGSKTVVRSGDAAEQAPANQGGPGGTLATVSVPTGGSAPTIIPNGAPSQSSRSLWAAIGAGVVFSLWASL